MSKDVTKETGQYVHMETINKQRSVEHFLCWIALNGVITGSEFTEQGEVCQLAQ